MSKTGQRSWTASHPESHDLGYSGTGWATTNCTCYPRMATSRWKPTPMGCWSSTPFSFKTGEGNEIGLEIVLYVHVVLVWTSLLTSPLVFYQFTLNKIERSWSCNHHMYTTFSPEVLCISGSDMEAVWKRAREKERGWIWLTDCTLSVLLLANFRLLLLVHNFAWDGFFSVVIDMLVRQWMTTVTTWLCGWSVLVVSKNVFINKA